MTECREEKKKRILTLKKGEKQNLLLVCQYSGDDDIDASDCEGYGA